MRRIDMEQIRRLCEKGHWMVRCGPGLYRCANCRTERRIIEGGR